MLTDDKRAGNLIAKVTLAFFGLFILLSFVGLIWIALANSKKEAAEARVVVSLETSRSVRELRRCFEQELRLGRQAAWVGAAKGPDGIRAFNSMTDIGVRLHDLGNVRRVSITTRLARSLRPGERDAIQECTAPPDWPD